MAGRTASAWAFGAEARCGSRASANAAAEANERGADRAHSSPPAGGVGDRRDRQTSAQAAECGARDIEAHGETDRGPIHLLGEIGHRDRRHAGERESGQRAQCDQRRPVGRKGDGDRRRGCGGERSGHDRLAPDGVRQRARPEHGDRQHARRRRQRQTRCGGRHREGPGEGRQDRLDAIEHREGRESAEEQGEADAPEPRLAAQGEPLGSRSRKAGCRGRNRHGRREPFADRLGKARQMPASAFENAMAAPASERPKPRQAPLPSAHNSSAIWIPAGIVNRRNLKYPLRR